MEEGGRERDVADREGEAENGQWYPADDIFTAVGQGGVAVTPLQLANAYAAFANGGTLWKPHIEASVSAPDSPTPLSSFTPQAIRQIAIPPNVRAAMTAGFAGVYCRPEGHRVRGLPGLPARHDSGLGQDGHCAGRRGGREG